MVRGVSHEDFGYWMYRNGGVFAIFRRDRHSIMNRNLIW